MILLTMLACFDEPPANDDDKPLPADTAADTGDDSACAADADADGACRVDDCDDDNPAVNPGAIEVCNDVDDDCDGDIDEELGGTYYRDVDEDGFGDAAAVQTACDAPDGYVDNGADCDDTDGDVFPGAEETWNGADDDCDEQTDEGLDPPVEFGVTVTWSGAGVSVAIEGGTGPYSFGMSETGAGAAGWFGESCVVGEEPWGYDDYDFDVCHGLGKAGGTLGSVSHPDEVVAGSTTLFSERLATNLTYMLTEQSGAACWAWGDDATYYDDFGCGEL